MTGRGTENVISMFTGTATGQEKRQSRILEIPITSIHPDPKQPRKHFDPRKITELALSIADYGVLQPIGVVRHPEIPLHYIIGYGERRWRATQEACLKTIPAIMIPDNADKKAIALIENLHRSDLTAMEKAMAIKEMMMDEHLSMEAAGNKLGISKTRVHQLLNILNLPEEMLTSFCGADLNENHARALLMLKRSPNAQKELFQEILIEGMTGKQALARAEKLLKDVPEKGPISDMVASSLKRLSRIEKKWREMPLQEREQSVKELLELRAQIDILIGNS
ncbi:ParB/RepB/Spo0J family partition protein [Desulforamulus ruminis]|uniref:ParB/RepB/Spo0J family partition protein n=1 Tax=Desulforamulus ruminis TaxID=1564 RepID=UPI002FD88CC4